MTQRMRVGLVLALMVVGLIGVDTHSRTRTIWVLVKHQGNAVSVGDSYGRQRDALKAAKKARVPKETWIVVAPSQLDDDGKGARAGTITLAKDSAAVLPSQAQTAGALVESPEFKVEDPAGTDAKLRIQIPSKAVYEDPTTFITIEMWVDYHDGRGFVFKCGNQFQGGTGYVDDDGNPNPEPGVTCNAIPPGAIVKLFTRPSKATPYGLSAEWK